MIKKIKGKSKGIVLGTFILYAMFINCNKTPVYAATVENNLIINSGTIVTFKDVYEYKYRVYNGKLQFRRWNNTRGCWADPYWRYC